MKPNEILASVTMLSSIASDLMYWLQDERQQEPLFKRAELVLVRNSLGSLMNHIPDSLKLLPSEEMSDLSGQIKGYLEDLDNMLQNLDLKKSTYVLFDTEFVLSTEFHRTVYYTVFNALNLLRSFERAIGQTFHPSGYRGIKPKAGINNKNIESIYNDIQNEKLIKEGAFEDFKAIFTDAYLPGTWHRITFHFEPGKKSGIKPFVFDLIEFITGQKVEASTANKYFRVEGEKNEGKLVPHDDDKTKKGKLYRLILKKHPIT
jgi:hypothetical protein